jgi:hypothetical protein
LVKGGVRQKVLSRKHDALAQLILDHVRACLVDKEALQPLRRNLGGNCFAVAANAGPFHGLVIDIGGKYLQDRPAFVPLECLQEQHANGVGFLARSHTGNPDPYGVVTVSAFYQGSDRFFCQRVKGLRVPEKAGHGDQHFPAQRQHLVAVVFQQLQVLMKLGRVAGLHAPLQPPHDGGRLVVGEIDAAELIEQLQDLGKHVVVRQRRVGRNRQDRAMVFIGLVADVCQQAQRQFVGRQDGSNHSRRNGAARHAVELG